MLNASDLPLPSPPPTAYLQLNARDEIGYDIRQHCDAASAFIQGARDVGGVCLVHCQAGVNRSGFLVVVEYMQSEQVAVLEAVRHCKRARGRILLNRSFQIQLLQYARDHGLLGDAPIAQLPSRPI